MLSPIGLGPPGTPRLNEPMLLRKASGTGCRPGCRRPGPGVRSVKISVAAGGGVKFRLLIVQLLPPWQLAHPAWVKSVRPWLTSPASGPLLTFGFAAGAFGVRTANRTHSLSAVSAGTCGRAAGQRHRDLLAVRVRIGMKLVTAHGGRSMLPLSPIMSPWFGSSVLVAGGGVAQAMRGREGPGARHVADVQLEVLDLVADRRVVQDPLVGPVVRVERRVERDRLARPVGERPDDAVGQALEVAARAVLPALAREPLRRWSGRCPAGRLKLPREEKNISAPTSTTSSGEPGAGSLVGADRP